MEHPHILLLGKSVGIKIRSMSSADTNSSTDEPTNHLDLEAINALNVAIQRYEGTVLLVTHDHDLIDEVATRIWHFEHGGIDDFKGPYEEYMTATAAARR